MNRTALRTFTAVACSAALATSLAACGSDDKDGDAKTPTLSAEEFKTQANQLCGDASKDAETYVADLNETSSDEDVTAAIDQSVERYEKLVDDVADLNAPDDLADDVESMLDSMTQGLTELGEISTVQELVAVDTSTGVYKEADDKARAIGLATCAE